MSGRYILQKHIKEISFLSNKLTFRRLFIRKIYPILKKHNPYVPILIREAMGVTPVLWIRYGFDTKKSMEKKKAFP
ncbi:unnamed protein product [Pneumocystis jirovecii]|uniref:Ribosomal protein/NADH dehydrogenase domain-containing protein n=1 Tax=Pneumocystis jirovecii TaxID=42068 RepID=L0PAB4_PNEJI|nr:unnamed protein product [Pneumocystis jirovecii]